jgi:type I restriction enzyme S subunit
MDSSFFSSEQAADFFYNCIRDNTDRKDARDFVQELWQKYKTYAEPDFLNDARKDFHAKTWEMYLGCLFLDFGLPLQKKLKKEGPDLHLHWKNRSIWIEATAPESGTGDNAVPEYRYNEVSDQPSDQIILRFASAIQKKFKKYQSYRSIDKAIIQSDDFYIIAINGGRIRYSLFAPTFPYIVLSVLPVGDLVFALDKNSGKLVNSFHQYRDAVTTAKGSSVPTNIFMNKDYAGISAVLYSWMNVVNRPNRIGVEIHCVHNPLADNKLLHGIFPFGTEWWVEDDDLIGKDHDE